ncbi:MAG: hypothetical protein DRJ28_00095 [Actinobacteria bacterium]|nr:MAG: hypothetical protein DRJ28_00095 [Actinomycetota bacterium]
MTPSLRNVLSRWWWARFHPLTRFGWMTATSGKSRTSTQTMVGIGLVGAGLVLKRSKKRKILYGGILEPGTNTRIKVFLGTDVIHDGPIGG